MNQGSRLLITSLLGSTSRTHVESLGKPRDSTIVYGVLPGKLDIKRHPPSILYMYNRLKLTDMKHAQYSIFLLVPVTDHVGLSFTCTWARNCCTTPP